MGIDECIQLCEIQFVNLLEFVRNDRRWRRRFCKWVWRGRQDSQDSAYRFLLYTAVLREVERQEELDSVTMDEGVTDTDTVSEPDDEERDDDYGDLSSPTRPSTVDYPSSPNTSQKSPGGHNSERAASSPRQRDSSPAMLPKKLGKVSSSSIRASPSHLLSGGLARSKSLMSPDTDVSSPLTQAEIRRVYQDLQAEESLSGRPTPRLPTAAVLCRLCRQAGEALTRMDTVCNLQVPSDGRLVVVGDLHGQFGDLLYVLSREQDPSRSNQFLFNGDFVDRGPDGCEIVCYLYCLLLLFPGCVWLNRGNHEDKNVSQRYGFGEELRAKGLPAEVWDAVQWSFEQLPLVYVLNKRERRKCVVLHGGLPDVENVTLDEINEIERKKPIPSSRNIRRPRPRTEPPADRKDRIFQALVWSDPRALPGGERTRASDRGAGFHFGAGVTQEFLSLNSIDQCIIRSHDVVHSGYLTNHQDPAGEQVLCSTVFSASNYHGPHSNQGAYVVVSPGEKEAEAPVVITPHQYYVRKGQGLLHAAGRRRRASACISNDRVVDDDLMPELEARAMAGIGSLIFQRRAQLMVEFQSKDQAKTGRVLKHDWVRIMQNNVSQRLPWWSLCRYLARTETLGDISYISFLERFQNRLFRKWMRSWTVQVLPHVSFRLAVCARGVQERMETVLPSGEANLPHVLSYQEVVNTLTRSVPGLTPTQVYYLFVCQFDTDNDGYLRKEEWDEVIGRGTRNGTPGVIELWGLRESVGGGAKSPYSQLISALRSSDGVPPEEFVQRANFALGTPQLSAEEHQGWMRTAEGLAVDGRITADAIESAINQLSIDQWRARAMEEIIESIARAKMHLRTVFMLLDDDQSNDLSFDEFREGMSRLSLSGDMPPDWEMTLFKEADTDSDGVVSIDEFLDALAVVDTWRALPGKTHRVGPSPGPADLLSPMSAPAGGGRSAVEALMLKEASPNRDRGDPDPVHSVEVASWQDLRGLIPVALTDASELADVELASRAKLLDREAELRERQLLRLAVGVNRACVRQQVAPYIMLVRK